MIEEGSGREHDACYSPHPGASITRLPRVARSERGAAMDGAGSDVERNPHDPSMVGEMTVTYTLADADGGTDIVGLHENVPRGVAPADNELGWRMSLDKLANLVETQ